MAINDGMTEINIKLTERRSHVREPIRRPCKIYDPRSRKYIPAVTRNISTGGALIDTPRTLDLPADTPIQVAIASHAGQPLLLSDDMVDAIVVRSEHAAGGRTTLGLRFTVPASEVYMPDLAAA